MILLATSQVLRKINKDKYNKIANEMVSEILLHFTEYGLIENVDLNGSFVNTATGRIVNPGHALEAAWFLMAEGQYQNDDTLLEVGKKIIDASMKYGYKDGGIIAFCDCLGKPAKALERDMYLWWPQCEAMIANLMAYKIFGEEKYLENYNKVKEFAYENFADDKNGEWYGYLHYDKTVANRLKGNIFKGPFHLPRMLILIDKLEKGEPIV
jgi:N-acylglucosamine 2-epimerase